MSLFSDGLGIISATYFHFSVKTLWKDILQIELLLGMDVDGSFHPLLILWGGRGRS